MTESDRAFRPNERIMQSRKEAAAERRVESRAHTRLLAAADELTEAISHPAKPEQGVAKRATLKLLLAA